MSRDTIGDFLTIIRNGVLTSKRSVLCPYSNMKAEIASLLKQEGFIKDFQVVDTDPVKKQFTSVYICLHHFLSFLQLFTVSLSISLKLFSSFFYNAFYFLSTFFKIVVLLTSNKTLLKHVKKNFVKTGF